MPAKSQTPASIADAQASVAADASDAGKSSMSSGGIASTAPMATAEGPGSGGLSDAQILSVTHTANVGEIEQAKLALTTARDLA
jgi:predicted outer membrane protein